MSSSKPSNHSKVAEVLLSRGFSWRSAMVDDVMSNSSSISFDDEWNEFIKVVQRITGITLATVMPQSGNLAIATQNAKLDDVLPALNADFATGRAFLNEPQRTAAEEEVASSILAWNCFQQVIDPAAAGHNSERKFDAALFYALRASLNGFVEDISEANWIVLKNCHVGFGQNIKRCTVGFEKGYALSKDSKSDHGCFVLGTDAIERIESLKAKMHGVRRKRKARSEENDPFWFNDLTATVELKLETTSCGNFTVMGDSLQQPDFDILHGPMGQAMMYTMDTWHCLARRGVRIASIPFVVFAGKATESENVKYPICCLEANIQIPQYCGNSFTYSVDRIISFNGTTGLSQLEVSTNRESRDKRAIAIYIKTMRFGLENALTILNNQREIFDSVPPVSLCCGSLLNVETNAQLIASPIPREKHQWKPELKISQGEFFQVTSPTKNTFLGLVELEWFVDSKFDDIPLTENCLVKVSCAAVHNVYVPRAECNVALTKLCYRGTAGLKASITKVLLGFSYRSSSKTLISIMKDLRKGDKVFKILEHKDFCVRTKLSKLWDGFCELAISLLLPMADLNVVHLDIRSNKEFTINILVNENENKIELRLIDFDSLVFCTEAHDIDRKGNEDAIWLKHLGVERVPAYFYLFWQVLWIAFRWHSNNVDVETNSHQFFSSLFKDDEFVEFKCWLGNHYATLKSMNNQNVTREGIQNALSIIKECF
jgi:hypothetical protein